MNLQLSLLLVFRVVIDGKLAELYMCLTEIEKLRKKKIAQSGSSATSLTRAQRYSYISRNNTQKMPPSVKNFPTPFQTTRVLINGQEICKNN